MWKFWTHRLSTSRQYCPSRSWFVNFVKNVEYMKFAQNQSIILLMQLPKVAAPMEFYLSYVHGKTTYTYTWRFHYAIKVHYMTCGLKPAGNKMIIQSTNYCFKYFQDLYLWFNLFDHKGTLWRRIYLINHSPSCAPNRIGIRSYS